MSEQNENKRNEWTAKIFQIGTAECAIFFGGVAMVLALLFLALGFWQTVLVALLMAIGFFIGGVKDKKAWIADKINKIFPPKQSVPYHTDNVELQRAVKAATESQPEMVSEVPAEEKPTEE
ncbi:MAG: DUF2273 domain-containing protein [Clostridia bacterium]|nr:DUF2273 domain-containing protein [Clostridia bacterium]